MLYLNGRTVKIFRHDWQAFKVTIKKEKKIAKMSEIYQPIIMVAYEKLSLN